MPYDKIVSKNLFGNKEATFLGFSYSVVLTGSMSGSIEANDVIVTHKQNEYSVGDVISYSTDATSVTHRIIEVTSDGYITKGDANNTVDKPIKKDSVIGKVIFIIPKIGAVIRSIRTPSGCLFLLMVLLVIIEIPRIKKYITGESV